MSATGKLWQVFPDGTQGKTAVTHYKVTERLGYVQFVECRLERPDAQIRVHLAILNIPCSSDDEYAVTGF